MRLILCSVLLAGCVTQSTLDDGDDTLADDEGKEDSATTLCGPLPEASRVLCLQIPNNGWRNALKDELTKPYFEPLAAQLAAARAADDASTELAANVYPPADLTFAALAAVSPGRVKAVIVGQDPYVGEGQAQGLSFSVPPEMAVPPSLNTIFAELVRENAANADDALPEGFVCPANGDLHLWAQRGVLLLNAFLTVQHGTPGSHKSWGWGQLTDAMLRIVRDRNVDRPVAYLLWGSFARAKAKLIRGEEDGATPPANPNVLILESVHPSPLASGFVGNDHFAGANRFLVERGRTPIDWSLPAPAAGTTGASCIDPQH